MEQETGVSGDTTSFSGLLDRFRPLRVEPHSFGRRGGGRGRGAADDHAGAEDLGRRRAAGPATGAGVS
jgi:hypothetical protein